MRRLYPLLDRLLDRVDPSMYHREAPPPDAAIRLRFLGTAGFEVRTPDRTLVIDPYLTRPSGRTTLFRRLRPDPARISRHLPRCDDVLIGHAHHDHVLDGPEVCRQTGARFIGSQDACHVARAAGLPEAQIRPTEGREPIPSGDGIVLGLPSAHGRVYFGRVALAGDIPAPPPWPARLREFRHGRVLNWYLEQNGVRIIHIDTAEFIAEEMAGITCDVLCLCAIGRRYRPDYTAEAIRLLRPQVVLPCHWDLFTTPLEDEPYCLPQVDLPGFLDEIRATGTPAVLLPFLGTYGHRVR